jgi:hypothetical protein
MNTGLIAGAVKPSRGLLSNTGPQTAVVSMSAFQAPASGAYVKVQINAETYDPYNLLSISNNVISLTPGTYVVSAICGIGTVINAGERSAGAFKLRNTSNSTDVVVSPEWCFDRDSGGGGGSQIYSTNVCFSCVVAVPSTENLELQVYTNSPFALTYVHGALSQSLGGTPARLTFTKVA